MNDISTAMWCALIGGVVGYAVTRVCCLVLDRRDAREAARLYTELRENMRLWDERSRLWDEGWRP